MTKGQLKSKITDTLINSIINISKDPTLGDSRKEQLKGLIFLTIANDYWDDCDDNEEIKQRNKNDTRRNQRSNRRP